MRLIDGDALKKKIKNHIDINVANDLDTGWNLGLESAIYELDNEPTIEDTSRPQGEWISDWRDDLDYMSKRGWKCSCCSWRTSYGTPRFCMNCGAEMKDGAK